MPQVQTVGFNPNFKGALSLSLPHTVLDALVSVDYKWSALGSCLKKKASKQTAKHVVSMKDIPLNLDATGHSQQPVPFVTT